MVDNILKKQLECINEDFLKGVFGQVGKPMWRALAHMFGAVTTGRSTLVSDIARTLRADTRPARGHTRPRERAEAAVHKRQAAEGRSGKPHADAVGALKRLYCAKHKA